MPLATDQWRGGWGGRVVFLRGWQLHPYSYFPVLSVGFISSDLESMIHFQVGLLDNGHINTDLLYRNSEALFSSNELLKHPSVVVWGLSHQSICYVLPWWQGNRSRSQ